MICDSCAHYNYDEESDANYCDVNFDEDELISFLDHGNHNCPYYSPDDDEYKTVRHQM
ncbi:MAG: hypothetical protein II167_05265 [Clostridiales bacterium]|nr:hypothetical protein [Clostridiales bacterium]